MSERRYRRHYEVHGLHVAIASDQPGLIAALTIRLRHFPCAVDGPPCRTFAVDTVAASADHRVNPPAGTLRPVYDPPLGTVAYSDAADQLYLDYDNRVRVHADPRSGLVRVSIASPWEDNLWLAAHPLFTLPFIELLKRHGRYSLHAAGLARDGRGLLLAGASGSGKTTLALALVRAGFGFLGDDLLFLLPYAGGDGVCVLAFPDELDLAVESLCFFPELEPLAAQPVPLGRAKHAILVEEVYQTDIVQRCRPAVIVFPRVANRPTSRLTPMCAAEALLELAPNVLLTEACAAQAHLDALAALVGVTRCYRLEMGQDLDRLPARLGELLTGT